MAGPFRCVRRTVAEAKDCPKCGLVNPPSAQRCDCGYDFVMRTTEQSSLSPGGSGRPSGGSRVMGYGCLALVPLLLLNGLVTAVQAGAAGGGDAFALGQVCGAFLPGLAALGIGVYLLRRGS